MRGVLPGDIKSRPAYRTVVRGPTNSEKIHDLMRALGRSVQTAGRVYFTGGVTAVLMGWRDSTMDVDLKADPEPVGFFEALPKLKEQIDLNIELASPDDFVPPLPGWRERCQSIRTEGKLEFLHYDFYGQALSKIERWHDRDQVDVRRMFQDGLVQPDRLWDLFLQVESKLVRYPAVNERLLRKQVAELTGK
jgi:hypothetical protein